MSRKGLPSRLPLAVTSAILLDPIQTSRMCTGALLTRGSLRLWAAATRCVSQPLDGGQK